MNSPRGSRLDRLYNHAFDIVGYDPEEGIVEPRAAIRNIVGCVEHVEYTSR